MYFLVRFVLHLKHPEDKLLQLHAITIIHMLIGYTLALMLWLKTEAKLQTEPETELPLSQPQPQPQTQSFYECPLQIGTQDVVIKF